MIDAQDEAGGDAGETQEMKTLLRRLDPVVIIGVCLMVAGGVTIANAPFFRDEPASVPPPSAADSTIAPPTFTPEPTQAAQPSPAVTGEISTTAQTYTVQDGDNLFRLALRFGVPLEELAAANNIQPESVIVVGQELNVPEGAALLEPTATDAPTVIVADVVPPEPTLADAGIITAVPSPLPPAPDNVNGVPVDIFLRMDDDTKANVRAIYQHGQTLNRNPRAFSKVGDSVIADGHFMSRFDGGPYNLGNYAYLQPTIDHFSGSFAHTGATVRVGMHTWSIFDVWWSDKRLCGRGEHALACEVRRHNPAYIFMRLGANDRGSPGAVDNNLRRFVEFCIENGIVPILGTKADRADGATDPNNSIIRQIAADYDVPLWDFDLLAATIPGRGLMGDQVHMSTFYAHDWTLEQGFRTGHGVHSLAGLIVLDELRRLVEE